MKYTRENLSELIQDKMSLELVNRDFVKTEIENVIIYTKKYSWGFDRFTIPRIAFLETHLEFGISISRRYNLIEEIWQDDRELLNLDNSTSSDTLYIFNGNASDEIKQKSYYDGSLRFEISEKGLAEIPEAIEFVMNKIFEKLDLFLNIRELDKYVNTQFQYDEQLHSVIYWQGLMYKRIIIAKLSGNSKYEELCDFMRESFDWYNENGKIEGQEYYLNYPIVFEKVYDRLKNIEQCENKILSTTDKIKVPFNEAIVIEVKSNQHPKRLLPIETLKNNSEIKNFTKFNDDGMIIPIKIGFGVNMFDNVSKQEYIDYVNCYSKQSVSWEYDGQKIILVDKNVSIKAYPSLDLKYVIAIYEGLEGEYKPPANAVIYNADGSIHTILKMPVLQSENILKRIDFNKDSNPPIEAALFEGGLLFSNFDWWQNEEGNLVNRIQIIYDRDWIEWRELEIRTGDVGRYLAQGKL